jgi:hypothetical protein
MIKKNLLWSIQFVQVLIMTKLPMTVGPPREYFSPFISRQTMIGTTTYGFDGVR